MKITKIDKSTNTSLIGVKQAVVSPAAILTTASRDEYSYQGQIAHTD